MRATLNAWKEALPAVLTALLLAPASYVAVRTLVLAWRWHTPVPQWDEVLLVLRYRDWVNGTIGAGEFLWQVHVNHRTVLTNLIHYADFVWLDGTFAMPKVVCVASSVALLCLLLGVISQILSWRSASFWLAAVLSTLLLFSTYNLENFSRGFNNQVNLYLAFNALALLLLMLANRRGARGETGDTVLFVLSIVCAVNATISYAAGLTTWGGLILLGLVQRQQRARTLVTVVSAAVMFSLYFMDYEMLDGTQPSLALQDPGEVLIYVLTFLGNPFNSIGIGSGDDAGRSTSLALFFGVLGAVLFLAFTRALWKAQREPDASLCPELRLLYALSFSIVLAAGATALGRVGLSDDLAVSGRRGTVAASFWVGVVVFLLSPGPALKLGVGARLASFPAVRHLPQILTLALIGSLLASQSYYEGLFRRTYYRHEEAALALAMGAPDTGTKSTESRLGYLWRDPAQVAIVREFLLEERLSVFAASGWYARMGALLRDRQGGSMREVLAFDPGWCKGRFGAVRPIEKRDEEGREWAQVDGWAWDAGRSEPAQSVLLVDSALHPIGYGRVFRERGKLAELGSQPAGTAVGWFGYARFRPGEELKAYALRLETLEACPLDEPRGLP